MTTTQNDMQSSPAPAPTSRRTNAIGRWMLNNGALVGLILLCIGLFIATPHFLTVPNLINVGIQSATIAILAFGMTFVIVTAGIDLSVGSIAALGAMTSAYFFAEVGLPGWVTLLIGLLIGVLAGAISGLSIAYGKLPAFIATLAMMSIARGATLVISQGSPIPSAPAVNALGRTGGNMEAARLSGLPVKRILVVVYALSGVFAALGGLVMTGRLSSAQPQAGVGYELDAIAAVVIGGASLAGGSGKASGTLIGAILLAVIRNGLNILNVSSFWQQIVIGVVIAVAVGFDVIRNKTAK